MALPQVRYYSVKVSPLSPASLGCLSILLTSLYDHPVIVIDAPEGKFHGLTQEQSTNTKLR
ncbi:hypothetical protein [Shewanella oncorhynchi]|uniref:hypothetical protein n=1 Tax=Shewanella oncorhynchi TaxID=2726434 RepID=UPI003D7BF8C0